MIFVLIALLSSLLCPPAHAQPHGGVLDDAPPELRQWAPWVLAPQAERACPHATSDPVCRWPSRLELDAGPDGARFLLDVHRDAAGPVVLPGAAGAWPAEVEVERRVDGGPGYLPHRGSWAVLDVQGQPELRLPKGTYRVRGRLLWDDVPPSLAVPGDVGTLSLRVGGRIVARPTLDSDGRLRIAQLEEGDSGRTRVEIDVSRRIVDGVPVRVTTQLDLRVSGPPRELDLGAVAVPGTDPVALRAEVPARFDAQGHLVVSVRAGSWSVSFDALHDGPVFSLRAPELAEPWPQEEFWSWEPDERVRAATPQGPPGVDPSRTPVPEAWRNLATFRVNPSTPLEVEQLRRGEPNPAPNALTLRRELWLDLDGGGLTARDHFTGELRQDWRLDAQEPMVVGHAAVGASDQVVTLSSQGDRGVELRSQQVDARLESRIEHRPGRLSAVGWQADVTELSTTLHVPPGWSLVAALGVDRVGSKGSMLARWTLWDLFFVLIVGVATWRILGWRWGALALVSLALGRHEAGAPGWTWALLVAVVAISRAVPGSEAKRVGRWVSWILLAIVAIFLMNWGVPHLREGTWPATQSARSSAVDLFGLSSQMAEDAPARAPGRAYDSVQKQTRTKKKLSSQYDPSDQIQTGPGVPTWSWRTADLRWSGPVTADHQMRLILLRPWQTAVLAWLRVGLFLLLAVGFGRAVARLPRSGGSPPTAASTRGVSAVVILLLSIYSAGGAAWAAEPPMVEDAAGPPVKPAPPDAEGLLHELETRLLQAPACRPSCVTSAQAALSLEQDVLTVRVQVHAQAASSWPVPGPAESWSPSRIQVDGAPAVVARLADGHLHVRLDPGVHEIVVVGATPEHDALTLTWGLPPHRVTFRGEGWSFEGRRADGSADRFAQITRMVRRTDGEGAASDALAPWVEVERYLDLGVPWRVRTTVRRLGPSSRPLALRVPLLEGESVTEAGYEGDEAQRLVTLARGQEQATWTSALSPTEAIRLMAPTDARWSERWRVSCSPVYACAFTGIPPIEHTHDGQWEPRFLPWSGEELIIDVSRPAGAEGATSTVDSATLELRPGRRQLEGTLTLDVRTSQGGVQLLELPPGARLIKATSDGRDQPLQLREDGSLRIPVVPGSQTLSATFMLDAPTGVWMRSPRIGLGGSAVNATVRIAMPEDRWLIGLFGPPWGPVPLYLVYLVLVIVGTMVVVRLPNNPLSWWQWALLGLGMTQVPPLVVLVVVGWLFALAWRARHRPDNAILFNLTQIGLVLYTLVALVCLYAAVHAGLLLDPDMQVQGNGSTDSMLIWYVDRVAQTLPRPAILSLPLWTWRVLMLLWSLWLAVSLLGWLRGGIRALGQGGWVRSLRSVDAPSSTESVGEEPAEPTDDLL